MAFNRTNTSGCPCKECPDRSAECHGQCGRYREWKAKVEKKNAAVREFHKSRDTISESKKRRIWRNNRYARQYGKLKNRENGT